MVFQGIIGIYTYYFEQGFWFGTRIINPFLNFVP
ncbi:hypothetical protein immuto35A_31 [Flavobacterium phage vB_FspM_immuto_3-5A]|uniref:Uncharacterized protein n=1 Tax=Flavobacterium phage vB_FspM_immuto_2-6A TaxID=2801477 RepID=A0A7T8IWJ3_9CAUD|nr:hypothetical protein KNV73_gp031 [Flavobacterium phage vB_FspM_immuto_2-6A]QQO91710.1 hypothetical protein immuto26A_31 [Flavobacterium phage vB_FspM_immuto_2-6A]QQO91949.1 hypothetical protein immuto35A_31 [Flavobacterium phage vB_FspM_immuto_3-5A]QQO92187.1 hypothetical protein immuto136C_31 [Flavobacterium phage vB_FspM_immuto_13-6C]